MVLPEQGHLFRMFIDESDKYEHIPLYESIVHEGLAPREKVQIKFYRSGKLDQHE